MKYDTGLRPYAAKRIEEIESADILVGIPCFNNEKTIAHVIQMVTHGLDRYFRDLRCVIFIADGGSTDDTRETAKDFEIKPWQEKLITIYRGIPGKGSALRSIFEASRRLKIKACAVVDADLRSITSEWTKFLLSPILEKDYHFVAPIYSRFKYDGTITNNIVYNLTRALYGKRIRQPIGGDFAFSKAMADHFISQEVWDTDIARYGIDIWMTTNAIVNNFKICQANLGVKIHDQKDPGESLAPMFRQVIWTLFHLMVQYKPIWQDIKKTEDVEILGSQEFIEPEPIAVDVDRLLENFKIGYRQFNSLWKEIFSPDSFMEIKKMFSSSRKKFYMPIETWVLILYELAAAFSNWPKNRHKLLDLMSPLYFARIASFIIETSSMDSLAAEKLVEEQAQMFEYHKDYLIEIWDKDCCSAGQS